MKESEQYLQWLETVALPFWLQRAWDPKHGGWFERLTPLGEPDADASRRTRVQSRQVTSLCQAAYMGWNQRESLNKALDTLDWWWGHSWSKDGLPGLCHQLDGQGQVISGKRDAYDHAFALLALAWAYRQTGDAQIQAMLDQVLDFLDEYMGHPARGLVEFCTPTSEGSRGFQLLQCLDYRRQNPHMHLFEASTAAHQALKQHGRSTERVDRYALECLDLFHDYFYDTKNSQIIEYFDQKWSPLKEPPSRYVEPGHGMEWVWLLYDSELQAEELGVKITTNHLESLNEVARSQGFDDKTGLLVNWFDPVTQTRSTAARSWPTMEMIRAGVALGLETQIERGAETLIRQFNLASDSKIPRNENILGGWRDSVSVDGSSADGEALTGGADSMQTSTLYHAMGVAMALRHFQSHGA